MRRDLLPRFSSASALALMEWLEARPPWLRPALLGAGLIYAFAILRGGLLALLALLILFVTGHQSEAVRLLIALLLVAPAGGFLGGLLYAAFAPLAAVLGGFGRFLQWAVGGFGYALALVYAVSPLVDGIDGKAPDRLTPLESLAIAGVIALLIGVALSTAETSSEVDEAPTSWRFVAIVVTVGLILFILMYAAGWV
jgi:hypothetical protein